MLCTVHVFNLQGIMQVITESNQKAVSKFMQDIQYSEKNFLATLEVSQQ